ncbi:MerR family transcriptional regulator [Desulfosediminicola flagellatus]|uniref:MerR family transcriptional regulator n=1 Tax=Desulfosediminicola flagellatus TaxID=2569541 RepID=UPI0010AD155A|nr:GyrI-like domain-containing protein [Desulfosediminicola flagellatus]
MKKKNQYFIGDMSRICNLSKKALRYYDQINLIPSHRDDCNNYRFYTDEAVLAVPVIKYYKQMGFTLEEMKEFIEGNNANVFRSIQHSFQDKIKELGKDQEEIRRKYVSVKDWYELIMEAETVIDNDIREVSVKFVEPANILFQNQVFDNDIKSSIINLEFTRHVEKLNNEITGPVIINYSSSKDRINNIEQNVRILQRTIMPCPDENQYEFGGQLMASCYHIGSHDNIHETYVKIERWARDNRYVLGEESFERYVTDYWTTSNTSKFVTEILIKASRPDLTIP